MTLAKIAIISKTDLNDRAEVSLSKKTEEKSTSCLCLISSLVSQETLSFNNYDDFDPL